MATIGEGANIAGALDSSAAVPQPDPTRRKSNPWQPGFLFGPPPATDPSEITIVVPMSGPANVLEGTATYERYTDETDPAPCAFPGPPVGTDLLVLDLDNGKSVWCAVIGPPAASARADLVLDTEEFAPDRRPRPVADPRPHHLVAPSS